MSETTRSVRPTRRTALVRSSVVTGLAAAAVIMAAADNASAAPSFVEVTSPDDAGPGTLRDALQMAQNDRGIRRIVIAPSVGTITPVSPLSFAGSQDLTVEGGGTVIDGAASGGDVLTLTAPAVSVRDLSVVDGPEDGLVLLAGDVDLTRVTVAGNAAQGVLVESANGVAIDVLFSTFDDNGVGVCDTDGMRVNETGAGSIVANFVGVSATNNDHDGIELDERGDGDAVVKMRNSSFTDNGDNDCAPPEVPEIDLEDGFDVDEFGEGNLVVDIVDSTFTGNAEEGLDLDEGDEIADGVFDGPGDLTVSLRNVDASDNGVGAEEDNIDIDENGDGNYTVTMVNVSSNNAFNDGYDGSEQGDGSLFVTLVNSSFSGSADGRGVDLGEDGDGSHTVTFRNVAVDGNDSDGVRAEEDDAGDMTIVATNSSFLDNGSDSIDLSKQEEPDGTLTLRNTAYPGPASLNLDNVVAVGG